MDSNCICFSFSITQTHSLPINLKNKSVRANRKLICFRIVCYFFFFLNLIKERESHVLIFFFLNLLFLFGGSCGIATGGSPSGPASSDGDGSTTTSTNVEDEIFDTLLLCQLGEKRGPIRLYLKSSGLNKGGDVFGLRGTKLIASHNIAKTII